MQRDRVSFSLSVAATVLMGATMQAVSVTAVIAADAQPHDAWHDGSNPVVAEFGRERLTHWSLHRPERPAVPATQGNWPRNDIDRLVLAQLTSHDLLPGREADRRTLIRRLCFDLHGLPPTPQQTEEFLNDAAEDAYERFVDRLLASPRYGERWGRHWLDIVRYADSNGFERDEFRKTMWRYRDYVIRAFNQDMPYDQFITEQLAGDELAAGARRDEDRARQLTATGFLVLGPFDSTKSGDFDSSELQRDQLLVDLTNTTAAAFLGQTFSCCRCHDHKYDPLLQSDHYRLRAFFAAVSLHEDVVLDPTWVAAEIRRHNAAIEASTQPLIDERISLLKRGAERIRGRRRAEFPVEIQAALEDSRTRSA